MSSYPNYNSHHGGSSSRSSAGGHSHSGLSSNANPTYLSSTFAPPATGPHNNYPYPTQQRSTPIPVDQHYHTPQPQTQAGYPYLYPSNPPHPQYPDARHSSGQTYSSFNRPSPSPNAAEHRRLPPLNPRDGWSYYTSHHDMQMPQPQPSGDPMRSPQAMPSSPASGYPQYQSLASAAYPGHSSSRGPVPTAAAVNSSYHQSMQMSHASLDRTTPSSRNSTQHPYSRDDPHIQRVTIELPPDPQAEPVIKKKRKRADARQLEVLNATYARTAFPSTEERAALAKQLDMSARSVQIWFQNKRQSFRQTRAAANPPPMSMPAPDPAPPSTSSGSGYRGSPGLGSPMVESSGPMYSSRAPPPGMMRSVQTPPPSSGRFRADDPRRDWPRGY
ncbi:hypothetical protein BC826DRAFT_965965 [Russula brevipes]|nr:hypothetical protein BC826DRAFT_965965 [Russula brevipes]